MSTLTSRTVNHGIRILDGSEGVSANHFWGMATYCAEGGERRHTTPSYRMRTRSLAGGSPGSHLGSRSACRGRNCHRVRRRPKLRKDTVVSIATSGERSWSAWRYGGLLRPRSHRGSGASVCDRSTPLDGVRQEIDTYLREDRSYGVDCEYRRVYNARSGNQVLTSR